MFSLAEASALQANKVQNRAVTQKYFSIQSSAVQCSAVPNSGLQGKLRQTVVQRVAKYSEGMNTNREKYK